MVPAERRSRLAPGSHQRKSTDLGLANDRQRPTAFGMKPFPWMKTAAVLAFLSGAAAIATAAAIGATLTRTSAATIDATVAAIATSYGKRHCPQPAVATRAAAMAKSTPIIPGAGARLIPTGPRVTRTTCTAMTRTRNGDEARMALHHLSTPPPFVLLSRIGHLPSSRMRRSCLLRSGATISGAAQGAAITGSPAAYTMNILFFAPPV